MYFKWDSEQITLKKFFESNDLFCSKKTSKITLDYIFPATHDRENCTGLLECNITDAKTINLIYQEMVEATINPTLPIWKHDTFIYTITKYLEEINSVSSIFLQPNISCAISLLNDGEYAILDETGVLIEGPYKKVDMIQFDTTKGINNAVDESLRKSLSYFQKYNPALETK